MADSPQTPGDRIQDVCARLEHDLCGPLITARGFLDEVVEIRAELGQWMADNRDTLSGVGGKAVEQLLEEELDVCVSYLEKSLTQLDERVITLARTLGPASASNEPK